jgi:hypothetical protein
MNFKKFIDGMEEPSFRFLYDLNAKHLSKGTNIYRGIKVPKSMMGNTVRDILLGGGAYKVGKHQSDPWTLDFPVAARFARGAAISPEGYSLGMDGTTHIIVEAELDGPSREQVDWNYWGKTIAGAGVSKGDGVKSYWQPYMRGKVSIEDRGVENEVPILHLAYPSLRLTGVYVKNGEGGWEKVTDSKVLG